MWMPDKFDIYFRWAGIQLITEMINMEQNESMQLCNFISLSKLSSDSWYMIWTAYQSLTNSIASHGKNEIIIRGSPKVLIGQEKWNDESWPALVSMQVLPVFYTLRWTVVTISLALGPGLAMCKLIRTHFIWLWCNSFQQQGYQHAGLINLCLVIYNLWRSSTAVRTYNCSPVQSVPWNGYGCSHGTLCF